MATYQQLATDYRRETIFGGALNFYSSFGQTFFIAMVLPGMAVAAGVSLSQAGQFYALATLCSALLLAVAGPWSDRMTPRNYAALCAGILGGAALLAAFTASAAWLVTVLILVRWAGQGLMPHSANVALAKRFPERPSAVFAVTSLGFPLGEAIFPAVVTGVLVWGTFRDVWLGVAALVAFLLFPVLFTCGKPFRISPQIPGAETGYLKGERRVWRDRRLWLLLPLIASQGFAMTGVLFYQSAVGLERGWDPWWWALGLSIFALTRAVTSLWIGGFLLTRSAIPWAPMTMMPITGGCLVLLIPGLGGSGLLVFFLLAGCSMGMAAVVGKTIMVEIYHTGMIGAAKSAFNALGVLSTAAAPAVYGVLGEGDLFSWSQLVLTGNFVVMTTGLLLTLPALPLLRAYTRA